MVNLTNRGVVKVKGGGVTLSELEKELSDIFCKEWPWQIRKLNSAKYLMRFPPHKKVADLKSLPSFNLRKEEVQVEVMEWVGDLEQFSELKEVWIILEGIPPNGVTARFFAQMTSSFGLLLDVDRSSLFKSFYEKIRIKVACRNPRKIPLERLFEMDKKLYLITIMVEGFEQEVSTKSDDLDDVDDLDDDEKGDGKEDDRGNDADQTHQSMETEDSGFNKFSNTQANRVNQKGSRTVAELLANEDEILFDEELGKQTEQISDLQSLEAIAHLYNTEQEDDWNSE
jgi:hypothetical protein